MRNARRLLAALLAVVMLIPSILVPGYAAETTGFKDVREDSWYANAVDYVSAAGYMKGTSKDAFSPGEDVSRAMFVTILSRVARAQTDNTVSAFGDVAANQYYSGAIEWAAEKEIVNGVGGGLFAPYRSITRQDLAVMLYRFVNAMGYELSAGESRTYTDEAAISAYAADAVRFVTSTGLFAGYQDGSFRPKATATRAQTAVIVMRLAQLLDGQIVDPEPMPAQSFDQTSEQMQVSVNAPVGALPENTKMTVNRVTDEAALAELASKVGAEVLGAADISFAKDGAELEPARKVSVRISLDALQSAKNPAVVHVKDDGSFEYVSSSVVTTRGKADAIEFEADSFSVYAVVGGEGGSHTLTITFYARAKGSTGAWTAVNKQIIRADQLGAGKSAVADPGVPNITTSQAFEGWIYGGNTFNSDFTYTADTTTYSVKDINDYHNANPLTADTEIVCYAAVYDVVYVTYHDQAGAVIHAEYEKLSGGYADKLINVPYNPFKANQHWAGWVPANYWLRAGDVNGTMPTYAAGADDAKWTDGSSHRLTASVDLYPYLEEGFWLYFDSNKSANNTKNGFDDSTSADYTPPVFVAHGKNTAAPAQPNRAGYDFGGWYTDKNMTTPFTFGSPLNEETVVYAKWTPAAASYTVVFMVQKATDPYDNDVSNNTYSFYDAVSRDWTWNSSKQSAKSCDEVSAFTASSVTQNDAYLGTGALNDTTYYPSTVAALGQYFKYSDKNTGNTVKVKGDGSTVLYVYYDRKPVTLKFYKGSYSSSTADTTYYSSGYYYYYTSFQYFGYISGNYVPLTLVYNSSQTSSQGVLIYTGYASFKVTSTGAAYTGTVYAYVRGTASANNLVASITGLYGADISETDKARFEVSDPYVYCYESGTDSSGNQIYTMNVDISEYVPGASYTGNAFTINYYLQTKAVSTSEKTLHLMSQDPETGEWGVEYGTGTVTNTIGLTVGNTVGRRFIGYNLSGDSMTASSFVPLDGNTPYSFYYANITGNDAYAYMELINYDLIFMSSTGEVRRETLRYQQKTAKYQYERIDENTLSTTDLYVPADGPAGYYFDGWYTDSTYQSEFIFTGKMPARNVTLYAKWSPMRFRVVCDPTDNGTNTDVSFSGNQTTMFVLNYDEKVDSIGLNSARSEGKILLGWFLDPDCTKPFSFETHLTPNTEGMDMTYAESTSRTWTDPWDGGNTVTDPENVRGILRLYAKWRVDPEGVVGIKVRYLGDHAENDKGYFDSTGKPHEVTMDEVYTDLALAAAHSASVPSRPDADTKDEGRRFLYWEILDKYGNPTGEIVYPGAPFTIDINKAAEIKTPLPDPNCTHTNEGTSTIVSVDAVAPTCTGTGVAAHYKCTKCGRLFADAAGNTQTTLDALTVAATGHDWETNVPSYTWSVSTFDENTLPTCTATVVCHNDANHVQTETASGTSVSLIVEDGGTTGHYVAHFENELFEDQTSSSFPISRLVVTYQANGETLTGLTETVSPNGTVTLPTAENVPALTGYTFVGWVTAEVADTTTAQTYAAPGATSDAITAPTTFIALYTHEQATGGTEKVYELVTSAPSDWTGSYLITSGTSTDMYLLTALNMGSNTAVNYEKTSSGATQYSTDFVELDGTTLRLKSSAATAYIFKMGALNNSSTSTQAGYYIEDYAANYYLGSYAGSSSSRYLYALDENTSDYQYLNYICWLTPSISNNLVTISAYYQSDDYKYITSGSSNSYGYIFGLGKSSTSGVYLWKETEVSATETHYTTTIPTYTVTYSVPAGVTAPEADTVVVGQSVTLPAAPEGTPEGYTFLGWTTAQTDNAAAQPATLTGEYTPVGSVTLYALYSFVEASGSVEYNLVTAAPTDWSGSYVITSGTDSSLYAMTGVSGTATGTDIESESNATALASTGMTLSGTKLTNVSDLYKFNVAKNGSYYTIRNASTNVYVGETASYLLGGYSTYVSGYCDWTPGTGANASSATIAITASGYPYLSFSSDSHYFWSGSTNNTNYTSVRWWKETPVGTTYYTTQIGSSGGNAVTQPKLSSGKADSSANLTNLSANANPNPVTATTDKYEKVTSFENGKKYLISYNNYFLGNTAYIGSGISNVNAAPTQGSDGYYTFSTDMAPYLVEASENNGTWAFKALGTSFSGDAYVGIADESTYGYGYCAAFVSTPCYWTLSGNYLLYTLSSGYYSYNYYLYRANGYFNVTTSTYSNRSLSFYKLVEDTDYTVTVDSSITNGTVSASPTTAAEGDLITLTVTPNTGYELATLTVTDASNNPVTVTNNQFTMPASNVTVYATFTPVAATTYSVTVDSSITNGTVTADKATAEEHETVTLTVSPNNGYELTSLSVTANGSSVTVTGSGSTYTFTMPASNVTVNATFTASSSPDPGTTTTELWVPTNTIVTGEEYLIGFIYNGQTHLALNYNPTAGAYYKSVTFNDSSYSSYCGYTGSPVFEGVNITGVTGDTTDLKYATWKFSQTTNGYYIVSGYESSKYLYIALSTSSGSEYYDQYASTSGRVWNLVYDNASNTYALKMYNAEAYAGVFQSTSDSKYYQACDGSIGTYTSVQLYRKQTVTVYNVTVNPASNGRVVTDHTTAIQGEEVTLTLTPSDGYQIDSVTVTDSNGQTVTVTNTSGGKYTFTMPASNVTVSATFSEVQAANKWKVSFADENGASIPGMNPMYVDKGSSLAESALPDPAKEDYYFLGWYQGNAACTFPMTVNSDIVLTPKYSPMYAYDYTITLRAVYGPYNPDATTHIYWYANNGTDAHNGAGERYTSEYTVTDNGMTTTTTKLPINAQVDIPLPTGNAASQTVFVGDNGGALTWEDHVFLGWARVDNGGTADAAEARILTPDDIYLKWTGTKYMVRNDDGTYSDFSSQKVYADETTPYHDMYAVWAGFYYIYHSSTGSLEAVQVPFDARETKDLVAEVKTNYLYGGYYKSSGAVIGVDDAEMRAAKDSILNQQNFWNYTDSCVASGSVTETSLTEEGAVVYNGTSVKHTVDNVTVPFWQKAQAYTELGTQLAPTAGTVYYLKEVPKTFLPNRLVYVKADKNTHLYDGTPIEEGELTSLYLLTAVDDRNYAANGFMVGTAHTGQNVSTPDANSGPADTVSRVFTIFVKNGETYSYNAHGLNDSIGVPEGMNPNLVGFVAAKHLDYNWIQAHKGQTDGTATFYLKPYWTTLDGVTVTQDNIKGVNITADGKGISFVNVQ